MYVNIKGLYYRFNVQIISPLKHEVSIRHKFKSRMILVSCHGELLSTVLIMEVEGANTLIQGLFL